jgi:DNA-directed RNA polymerase subunit RPC12/RpoP
MLQSYECFDCRKVSIFTGGEDQTKCNTCGSANIQLRSTVDGVEGMKAGVYFNIDPKTAKSARPKRR